jgi:hypothetical protein
MGIVISLLSDGVEFQFATDRKRRLAFGEILECSGRREIGTKIWKIRVRTSVRTFVFKYSDLTTPAPASSPTEADIDFVTNLILVYNSGGGNKTVLYATAGQTSFPVTFTLSSNCDVYINGVLQAAGFSWTPGTTTVTSSTPMTGGEELIFVGR